MIRALLTIDDVSSKNTPAIVDYLNEKKYPVEKAKGNAAKYDQLRSEYGTILLMIN